MVVLCLAGLSSDKYSDCFYSDSPQSNYIHLVMRMARDEELSFVMDPRVSVVRYYTTITFKTSSSLLSSFLKAQIVIILYGDGGETESIQLKRYHYLGSVFSKIYWP